MIPFRTLPISITFVIVAIVGRPLAVAAAPVEFESGFHGAVRPFVETYCFKCHSGDRPKGDFDLSAYSTVQSIVKDEKRWELVLTRLKAGEMPPEKAKKQPTAEARRHVIEWIQSVRQYEANLHAGDPGPVLARRLSNAEYDYTIRDLTGVDIQPTKAFPVDPANEAGFDNSGESLAMSPALLKKYIEAARHVSEYLVLKPNGLAFAPFPMSNDTDRDKYCVRRIIQFYQKQPIDYADYFLAAWRFKNRAAIGKPTATLADFAAEAKVSPKYLATVWSTLTENQDDVGPIRGLVARWDELPAPDANEADVAQPGCERMRDLVVALRQKVKAEFKNLNGGGLAGGSQPLVLWKDRQYAANRMTYPGGALKMKLADLAEGTAAASALAVPADDAGRERYEAEFKRFCAVFPDAFFVSERARMFLNNSAEDKYNVGRFLSAGFHSQMGYFRDDVPLCDLILDAHDRGELDTLWQELDFIASAPMRQHLSFIWFERGESNFMRDRQFDFARAEDRDATSQAKLQQLADVYLAKIRAAKASETVVAAVENYFKQINAANRWVEQARIAAEPSHVTALQDFAQRAYRRNLSPAERDDIAAFYLSLRKDDGLEHEEAVKDTLVSILVSPNFCYRIDAAEPGQGITPLSDNALASRLSYFLWSSMPDEDLLAHAATGDLHRPDVLVAQAKRMLADDRIAGLATEFGGNWLDFRRFEELNSVDRGRFPNFTNDLREAMFQEPIHYFVDLVHHDRSVLDFIYGDYTFVNSALAKHYGMWDLHVPPGEWMRVDKMNRYQRGGLLPMAVFLTKNAPGLRTSPVKRGYWVIRRLLGERIPAPPPNVGELPSDEAHLGDLTLRQALARHRADSSCAGCHVRFDSIGLVFEGYGAVGELRMKDFGGKLIDNHATFLDGSNGVGLEGLRAYLRKNRQDDYLDNLCRKLLAYALGRGLMLSDEPLITEMRTRLPKDEYRFSGMIESIVTSKQFLNKRGQDAVTADARASKE